MAGGNDDDDDEGDRLGSVPAARPRRRLGSSSRPLPNSCGGDGRCDQEPVAAAVKRKSGKSLVDVGRGGDDDDDGIVDDVDKDGKQGRKRPARSPADDLDDCDGAAMSANRAIRMTTPSCQALRHAVSKLYRIDDFVLEQIGVGFFSDVFKVADKGSGKVMVLKLNKFRSNRTNMLKEVQLMNSLRHPNILRLEAACVHEGQLHALTEYIDGGNLEQLIGDKDKDLPWSLRISLALDMAKGLAYLHSKGMFHRDLTSKNVLVRRNDRSQETAAVPSAKGIVAAAASTGQQDGLNSRLFDGGGGPKPTTMSSAVIADFGLATRIPGFAGVVGTTHPAAAADAVRRLPQVGSPYWMSPECLRGKFYDEKSDVFSYGIILCELIGRTDADPDYLPRTENFGVDYIAFSATCPDCPLDFLQLAFKCVQIDPESRPKAADLATKLEGLLDSQLRSENCSSGDNHDDVFLQEALIPLANPTSTFLETEVKIDSKVSSEETSASCKVGHRRTVSEAATVPPFRWALAASNPDGGNKVAQVRGGTSSGRLPLRHPSPSEKARIHHSRPPFSSALSVGKEMSMRDPHYIPGQENTNPFLALPFVREGHNNLLRREGACLGLGLGLGEGLVGLGASTTSEQRHDPLFSSCFELPSPSRAASPVDSDGKEFRENAADRSSENKQQQQRNNLFGDRVNSSHRVVRHRIPQEGPSSAAAGPPAEVRLQRHHSLPNAPELLQKWLLHSALQLPTALEVEEGGQGQRRASEGLLTRLQGRQDNDVAGGEADRPQEDKDDFAQESHPVESGEPREILTTTGEGGSRDPAVHRSAGGPRPLVANNSSVKQSATSSNISKYVEDQMFLGRVQLLRKIYSGGCWVTQDDSALDLTSFSSSSSTGSSSLLRQRRRGSCESGFYSSSCTGRHHRCYSFTSGGCGCSTHKNSSNANDWCCSSVGSSSMMTMSDLEEDLRAASVFLSSKRTSSVFTDEDDDDDDEDDDVAHGCSSLVDPDLPSLSDLEELRLGVVSRPPTTLQHRLLRQQKQENCCDQKRPSNNNASQGLQTPSTPSSKLLWSSSASGPAPRKAEGNSRSIGHYEKDIRDIVDYFEASCRVDSVPGASGPFPHKRHHHFLHHHRHHHLSRPSGGPASTPSSSAAATSTAASGSTTGVVACLAAVNVRTSQRQRELDMLLEGGSGAVVGRLGGLSLVERCKRFQKTEAVLQRSPKVESLIKRVVEKESRERFRKTFGIGAHYQRQQQQQQQQLQVCSGIVRSKLPLFDRQHRGVGGRLAADLPHHLQKPPGHVRAKMAIFDPSASTSSSSSTSLQLASADGTKHMSVAEKFAVMAAPKVVIASEENNHRLSSSLSKNADDDG